MQAEQRRAEVSGDKELAGIYAAKLAEMASTGEGCWNDPKPPPLQAPALSLIQILTLQPPRPRMLTWQRVIARTWLPCWTRSRSSWRRASEWHDSSQLRVRDNLNSYAADVLLLLSVHIMPRSCDLCTAGLSQVPPILWPMSS